MEMKKITIKEAENIPLDFKVPDDFMERGRVSLEAGLRAHGWKGNQLVAAGRRKGSSQIVVPNKQKGPANVNARASSLGKKKI
ncbi:MAG: hypothetical protein LBG95_00955 [Treponema sp.]|jgi:hypothetical protein|nr:hypothetical protein [Treponema sp.]